MVAPTVITRRKVMTAKIASVAMGSKSKNPAEIADAIAQSRHSAAIRRPRNEDVSAESRPVAGVRGSGREGTH